MDGVGNDVHRLPLAGPVGGIPLAPLEAAIDRDRPALLEVGRAVLALLAPDGDVEVVGLVDPLARRVLPARVARDPQLADGRPARRRAELGVTCEVPGEHDSVDVGCGHRYGSLTVRGRSLSRSARLHTESAGMGTS